MKRTFLVKTCFIFCLWWIQQLYQCLNLSLCGWQAWAVASGKINEFPNDKARWKTNFRCALNNLSERFRMIKDNSKNSDDPHKIYEIINTECKWDLSYTFTVEAFGMQMKEGLFSLSLVNYEGLPAQDSQEDSDMNPDIYIECFPSGNEVQYCLEWTFTSLLCLLPFTYRINNAVPLSSKQHNLLHEIQNTFMAMDLGNRPPGT